LETVTTTTPAPHAKAETPPLQGHVAALDGIRGLAILLVMQFHAYSLFGLAYSLTPDKDLGLLDRTIGRVSGVGWAGVDLFFVLSGFLITGILYDARSSGGFFRNFYARRFLRIFPLYYGFLFFIIVIVPHIGALDPHAQSASVQEHQVWYWTYSLNVWAAVRQFHASLPLVHSHFWSLAVEEQFYLVWPAAVFVVDRSRLMRLCVLLTVGAVALRVFLVSDAASSWANANASHVLMPSRFDTFALGAFIALAARGAPGELARLRSVAPIAGGVALAVLIALFVWRGGLVAVDGPVETAGFSALAVLFASLLVLAVTAPAGSALHRAFSGPVLGVFGRYAYALYVVHLLVTFELLQVFHNHGWYTHVFGSQAPSRLLFTLAVIGVSLIIAWLSWHLYEKQFLKLKVYFPYGRQPQVAGAPAGDAPAPSAAV
jgi:peptidoglycan/LPS O-acetylase OafA/YrhL